MCLQAIMHGGKGQAMGFWDKAAIRDKLMPLREQEAFLRTYGEAAKPMLEAVLDARVDALAARYKKAWGKFLKLPPNSIVIDPIGPLLVTREEAAKMLNISLSTIKRMEASGELPEPQRFGERAVRHKLDDILAFARCGREPKT